MGHIYNLEFSSSHIFYNSFGSLRSFELESEEMLNSFREGGRISFPVSEKGEREAVVPFSSGTVCAPYFP